MLPVSGQSISTGPYYVHWSAFGLWWKVLRFFFSWSSIILEFLNHMYNQVKDFFTLTVFICFYTFTGLFSGLYFTPVLYLVSCWALGLVLTFCFQSIELLDRIFVVITLVFRANAVQAIEIPPQLSFIHHKPLAFGLFPAFLPLVLVVLSLLFCLF